ncbi:MAG: MnmC family methyltransferase [Halothece sp. Uz-M2-17]|nr:MnmC family methyltransferase [Halothece sp. Uz-M2-17]
MSFTPQRTSDGSYTFFSSEFKETFHSLRGAKEEAQEKFIIPCQLANKAKQQSQLKILDICYGLGYNTAAAMETIWAINPECYVEVIALESDLRVPQATTQHHLLDLWSSPIPELLTHLAQQQSFDQPYFKAELLIGDARKTIQDVIQKGFYADAIFLDPFSPPHCPQLWTVEFLARVAQCLHTNGRLATYSCAAAMRTALSLAGLYYSSTMGMNRRSTVASWNVEALPPLSQLDQEHQQTRAAIPYRDPTLEGSTKTILNCRQQEQLNSKLETTSQWRKRWRQKVAQESDIVH